jgi:hypothetical protein
MTMRSPFFLATVLAPPQIGHKTKRALWPVNWKMIAQGVVRGQR